MNEAAHQFRSDIEAQPAALRRVAAWYASADNDAVLRGMPRPAAPLFTGMGASFHAVLVAATHLWRYGVPARALEATDLLLYGETLVHTAAPLVFVSQSGESAEVAPLTDLFRAAPLLAVTNTPASTLAQRAGTVLPLHAGPNETLVATRTYTNTLAVMWLLARRWAGVWNGGEYDALARAAEQIAHLLAHADAITTRWLDVLHAVDTLVFVGHGPHGATARHAAMMLGEWAKQPALGTSIGAFRHGLIEIAGTNTGVVIFSAPGPGHTSAHALAAELAGYNTPVLLVEHGHTHGLSAPTQQRAPDEFLAPILDVVPAQVFAEAWSRQRGVAPQFRYIGKVITRL